jgi:hypothetical protein
MARWGRFSGYLIGLQTAPRCGTGRLPCQASRIKSVVGPAFPCAARPRRPQATQHADPRALGAALHRRHPIGISRPGRYHRLRLRIIFPATRTSARISAKATMPKAKKATPGTISAAFQTPARDRAQISTPESECMEARAEQIGVLVNGALTPIEDTAHIIQGLGICFNRYVPSTFFQTMPSAPRRYAQANAVGPSSSMCSNRLVEVRRCGGQPRYRKSGRWRLSPDASVGGSTLRKSLVFTPCDHDLVRKVCNFSRSSSKVEAASGARERQARFQEQIFSQ